MKRMLLAAFAMLLFFCYTSAQVKTKIFPNAIPARLAPLQSTPGQEIQIPLPPEFARLKRTADSNAAQLGNRFALAISHNIDFIKRATVISANGMNVYTLTIKAAGALNINCQFSEFRLPAGAVLKIFTQREITDSITEKENNPYNLWATRVYQGDELHFTLSLPEGNHKNLALTINNVNIGFKLYGSDFGNIGASANCHRNVVCPEGSGWEPERNAVALIVANGNEACTGSLIMNTCNSNIPYFLTAEHCLDAGNVPNWVFQFQTWSTDCNSNVGWIETVQFNGCQLRAANEETDFALLELNTVPPANSGIHYAGWSRETTHSSTTVIHHPAGDLMKISRDNQAPVAVTDVTDRVRQCWEINQDLGRLEGGSSGAPYFNQDHRIIGTHFRRPQVNTLPVCDITIARGGRFEPSWAGGGTNATRLSNWLDPAGTGVLTTNTTNRAALPFGVLSIAGSDAFCSGTSEYFLHGAPPGATITWGSSNTDVATVSGINPGTVTQAGNGVITLTAHISLCGQTTTVAKFVSIGIPPPEVFTFNGATVTPGVSNNCIDGWADYEVSVVNPASGASYWWAVSGGDLRFGQGTPDVGITTDYNSSDWLGVYVQAQNSCGLGDQVFLGFPYCPMFTARSAKTFLVTPNPATDIITIQARPAGAAARTTVQPAAGGITEIRIFDNYGNLKKQVKLTAGTKQAQVNVSNLPTGIYVVEISTGKSRERQRVMIRK